MTVLEFRCLLARRRRAADFDRQTENRIFAVFESDITSGFLNVHPLSDRHASVAVEILSRLPTHPLRSLDALHLAIALELGAAAVATADRGMAKAARALGIEVVRFD